MKRWFLAAVLVVLVLAFGFLKQGVHKSSMTEEEQQQAAQEAQKAQADKAEAAAKKTTAPAVSAAPGADDPPAEEVVGDPATAKHHIQVGWIYEDTDAVNSDKLKAVLSVIRTFALQSGGAVSAVIVDADVPAEDRSPAAQGVTDMGVEMDGQSVYDQNPSGTAPGALAAALQGAIKP